jgi:hypothetical protein
MCRQNGERFPFRSPLAGGTLVVAASTCFATARCGGTTGWLRLDSLFFFLVADDEERTVPMFRLIWIASDHARYFLRRYMPTNILLDAIRTRRGLKWGVPAMLLALPYLYVGYLLSGLIEAGGPGWLHLLVLLCIWNAMKMTFMGPVSVVLLLRARAHEYRIRRRARQMLPAAA